MIWYLIIFGYGYHTALKVPEPSRDVCIQQARALDAWMKRTQSLYVADNAFCVQGSPQGKSAESPK